MSSAERSQIANAIWLCSSCHKLVDDDPLRYPAGLLFEWQREHEGDISLRIGKASAEVRRRYENRLIEGFGKLSYMAERILLEKEDYWEYRLTVQVLRFEMSPIMRRWDALKKGLYIKPLVKIELADSFYWLSDKLREAQLITDAFTNLVNVQLKEAWGEQGIPGSDIQIVETCRLFSELCSATLAWEEAVRFARLPDAFSVAQKMFWGVGGQVLDEARKLPDFISSVTESPDVTGTHHLQLLIEFPESWVKQVLAEVRQAAQRVKNGD